MIDIDLKSDDGKFKFRVCGLIQCNKKFLIQRIESNDFYCLPGGHVELGEDTLGAIKREMKEEIGKDIKNEKLFLILENFFKSRQNKIVHELGFYFKADIDVEDQKDYQILENDKGVMKKMFYKWVSFEELEKIDFRPSVLKDIIKSSQFEGITHIIQND